MTKVIEGIELNRIYNEDCLEGMRGIPDKSVDMILCDLPYGTTACKWDTIIPFEPLWAEYERVIKDNGAIVLTASQPFTSALVMSRPNWLKHHWVWNKERGTGFQIAKYRPMMQTEDVLVFTRKGVRANYYPQMIELDKPRVEKYASSKSGSSPIAKINKGERVVTHRYPKNLLTFKRDGDRLHPTQKPVALFEYLIRTYTNEGETVLDNCIGSGTTAVAAINTNRNFIGFELEKDYVDIANNRIEDALAKRNQDEGGR